MCAWERQGDAKHIERFYRRRKEATGPCIRVDNCNNSRWKTHFTSRTASNERSVDRLTDMIGVYILRDYWLFLSAKTTWRWRVPYNFRLVSYLSMCTYSTYCCPSLFSRIDVVVVVVVSAHFIKLKVTDIVFLRRFVRIFSPAWTRRIREAREPNWLEFSRCARSSSHIPSRLEKSTFG